MNSVFTQANLEINIKRTIFVEDYQNHVSHMGYTETNVSNTYVSNETCKPQFKNQNKIELEKYFAAWKKYAHNKRKKLQQVDKELQQNEKLESFIKTIKEVQKKHAHNDNSENKLSSQKKVKDTHIFHRFQVQKEIIQMQKNKLHEQQNVINQLRLGILENAVDESMIQAKKDVTNIMQNCSIKLKYKMKSPVFLNTINKDLLELGIKSCKVPKVIRELEKRAAEREQRRQLITERKRVLDEAKKRVFENDLLEKRTQDEETRKQCMEELQKRRKAQLKFFREIKLNREKMLSDTAKADDFYKKKLKRFAFALLHKLIWVKRYNTTKSETHYDRRLKERAFECWIRFVVENEYKRNYNALQLYNYKMKSRLFSEWYKMYSLSLQHKQVAEDFYLMQLERRFFNYWNRFTCSQQFLEAIKFEKALKHYQNWILLHYFYQWRSFPAVMAIKRAKEEKKRKWREKVWEILPDYKPVIDNSF